MFKSEDEMQEKLYKFLVTREKNKNKPRLHFYREVEMVCAHMRPDIMGFDSSDIICYELKLKASNKIAEQGYKAMYLDKGYIVLPPVEAQKMKEGYKQGKYRYDTGEVGIMSFDGSELKVIRGCKVRSKEFNWYKREALNAVVRGFYHGGINERGREDRQGW